MVAGPRRNLRGFRTNFDELLVILICRRLSLAQVITPTTMVLSGKLSAGDEGRGTTLKQSCAERVVYYVSLA